jgi:hypothetical protein
LPSGPQPNHSRATYNLDDSTRLHPTPFKVPLDFDTCNPAFNVALSNYPTNLPTPHGSLPVRKANLIGLSVKTPMYHNSVGNLPPFFLGPRIAHHASNTKSGGSNHSNRAYSHVLWIGPYTATPQGTRVDCQVLSRLYNASIHSSTLRRFLQKAQSQIWQAVTFPCCLERLLNTVHHLVTSARGMNRIH